jgi:hypothetical protein
MATKPSADSLVIVDGSFDFSGGVDSSKVTTVESTLNVNGLGRNELSWANNCTVRNGGITQRWGWQPLVKIVPSGYWQGHWIYEPDSGLPYLICSISGHIYQVLLDSPYTVTDLSVAFGLYNPSDPTAAEMAFFCQGENYLIIQAGDFYHPGAVVPGTTDSAGRHLPLFWNGSTLRRSIGITNPAPAMVPGVNEIPAATCMDYYGNRIWYAQGRQYSAGDIVGGPSGNAINLFRDAILNVTENPLCTGGDGFTVPTNAGNIRSLCHSSNLNASLGQGQFYIGTRKAIYSLSVPMTRTEWIATDSANGPLQTVVQLVNGPSSHRAVTPINGDLYYQSFDPAIRSLIRAIQYFQQPGNTAISQNEDRALRQNNRALMRFSSSMYFDTRLLNLVLPKMALDGVNVVHQAVLPLDFDTVSNLAQRSAAVWEGAWDGLQFLELIPADYAGLPRGLTATIDDIDGSINLWEMVRESKMENGDNRVTWSVETPAWTWSGASNELALKRLAGGECHIDRVSGTVKMWVYYRNDADPCWRCWFDTEFCADRWEDEPVLTAYPCEPMSEGYVFPVVFPEPPSSCNSMGVRPSTVGYQFQVKIVLKGFCRIRSIMAHALPVIKSQYNGISCKTTAPGAMSTLPFPFVSQPIPDSACIQAPAGGGTLTPPPADETLGGTFNCKIITPNPLPDGTAEVAYSVQISAQSDLPNYIFSITEGALPNGLSMNSYGKITGTPSAIGTSIFTVSVTGEKITTCSKQFQIAINNLCSIPTQSFSMVVGYASFQIVVNPSGPTYTFSLVSGAFVPGLSMSPSGLISGIAFTIPSQYTAIVQAVGSNGSLCTGSITTVMRVTIPPPSYAP